MTTLNDNITNAKTQIAFWRSELKRFRKELTASKLAAKASKVLERELKQEQKMAALDARIAKMLEKAEQLRMKRNSPKALKAAAKKASKPVVIKKAA